MKNYNRKEVTTDYTKYYLDNKYHRLDGPAVEWANGSKEWYINGQRHRTDGPAIERADGYKFWYINGKEYSEKEFNRIINPPNCPEYLKI